MSSKKNEEQNSAPAANAPLDPSLQIQVDDYDAVVTYANYCRVTTTPEELVIDFALNTQTQVSDTPAPPINLKNRVVLNFYTAKRLLHALSMSVQRHEAAFGVLEVNVQKRLENQRRMQQRSK